MNKTFGPPRKPSFIPYHGNPLKYNGSMILFHQKLQEILESGYLWTFNGFTHEYDIQTNKFNMAIQIYKEDEGYAIEIRNMLSRHRGIYIHNYNYIVQRLNNELDIKNVKWLYNIYDANLILSATL